MKRFTPTKAPRGFKTRCLARGKAWLAAHPGYDRPHDYWSEFEPKLREVFQGLCSYCVMIVMKAQTDHFVPVAILKQHHQDHLAYDWKNFRYGEAVLNGRKSKHLVLDPFEVQDDWFEIQLPSLQLLLTDMVPNDKLDLAKFTLKKLGLRDDEVVVRYRSTWFEMYRRQELNLEGLKKVAPLIARAVEADLGKGKDWRYLI